MDINLASNFLVQSDMQKEALNYYESLTSDPNGWKLCSTALVNEPNLNESRAFFCLLVIENYVKTRYQSDTAENQAALRQFVFSWFTSTTFSSAYILNKYAVIVDEVFLVDFPANRWGTFFHDFLVLCQTQKHCDLFLRILLQINVDVADREIPRSPKENERNNLIKDMMRQACLLELAQFWFNIINTYRETNQPLVHLVLEVIGAYVAWIDISLITNDAIMSNLFSLFEKPSYRCAVCDCFNNILHKGMDPIAKTQLIEQFMEVDAIKEKLRAMVMNSADASSNEDFRVKLSRLLNTIGIQLVDSLKKIKPKNEPAPNSELEAQVFYISTAIEKKFALLCCFLGDASDSVSIQVHPFTREYIQWIKNSKMKLNAIDDKAQEAVSVLAKLIVSKSKRPSDYDFESENEEDDECRKSCKTLFDNLMFINSTFCVNMVCSQLIEPVLKGCSSVTFNFADVEVSLYFFYLIGEHLGIIFDQKQIEDLLQLLISTPVSSFRHPSVQAMYFELIVRYEKHFAHNLNYLIPQILVSFLDERGLKNRSEKLRSRACQLFHRFIKCHVKSKAAEKVNGFTEDILKRLEHFLTLDALDAPVSNGLSNGKPNIFDVVTYRISEEDQLVIFETVATLIVSNPNYQPQKKHMMLKNIVKPLWDKFNTAFSEVEKNSQMKPAYNLHRGLNENHEIEDSELVKRLSATMSHCVLLVSRTSKGFSNVHPIKVCGAQDIYLESFNLFVKALRLKISEESLAPIQSAIRQLLHRLIVCLEEVEVIPIIPYAIENVFVPGANLNARTIQELVPLINQVVTKFKHSWMFQRDLLPFLKQMFIPLVSSIFSLTSSSKLSADEIQSLQKCYYSFLAVLAGNNVMEVFHALDANTFEQVLITLVQGGVDFPDVSTQKTCFIVLKKIIESYGSVSIPTAVNSNGASGDAGKPQQIGGQGSPQLTTTFVEFIYKAIVPACVYAPLKQTESDVTQLIVECISCLKSIVGLRGSDEPCAFLSTRFFPENFPTYANNSDFVQSLARNEVKNLRSQYKMLMQLKRQANGNCL
ncbi:Exportin-T [Halotydeus destructor]|nr:Exportin-T [Halotydeus destructor]